MLQNGINTIADLNDYGNDFPEYKRGQIDLLLALVGYNDDGTDLRDYIVKAVNNVKLSDSPQRVESVRCGNCGTPDDSNCLTLFGICTNKESADDR